MQPDVGCEVHVVSVRMFPDRRDSIETESDPRWDTQGLSRRALHPSKTCSSPTAAAPHDAACPPAVHNQRCRSHSIQTKTMLRSVCLVQSPKGPPPARMCLPVALSPTSPPRCALRCRMLHPHDASEHPLAKAVQGISSLPQPRHLTDAAVSVARPLWRPRLSSTLLRSSNRLASSP